MNKIIRSKKTIAIILIVILIAIFYILITRSRVRKEADILATPIPKSRYNDLTLGSSSRNDVVREIGNPQKETTSNNVTTIEYATKNPNFNDQFMIDGEKLNFIKKIITIDNPIRTSDMEKKYGSEEKILYGPGSGVGLYLYCYPSIGIAYLGHKKSGYMTEIWYFTPTTYENFKEKFAKDFSEVLLPS